ncbi:MAG: methyltransferase [Chloroflexia bacterium]|nr:methyltransferase [Chloroflexia bacterium]
MGDRSDDADRGGGLPGVGTTRSGAYRLTSLGDGLREDAPGSLASFAILSGEDYYRAWQGVDLRTRDDVTPFARVFGAPVFDWYAQHPEAGDRFYQRMTTRIVSYAATVARVADLSAARRIVDIGGGHGLLLAAFLERWPNVRGVLFDLPGAAAAGQDRLAAMGLAGRVEVAGGDFFDETELLPEGDVYLLSQILHDGDDARSAIILRNIRRVINPEGHLLIVEVLMPVRVDGPHPAIDLDLLMMVLTGGRERTASEYRNPLEKPGFALERVHEGIAPGGMSVLEARPV